MQTIEFEAQLNEGSIHLPPAYRHWHEGQKVKIIISSDDHNHSDLTTNKKNVSCLDLVEADVDAPGDLSSSPEYLKGYGD